MVIHNYFIISNLTVASLDANKTPWPDYSFLCALATLHLGVEDGRVFKRKVAKTPRRKGRNRFGTSKP
jgi:hypothetical protein